MEAQAIASAPSTSRVHCVRTADGAIVTVQPPRSWRFAIWLAALLVAAPLSVFYRLALADAVSTAGVVLSVLHFSRARRLRFAVARDRLSVRAVTERAFAIAAVERFAVGSEHTGGEPQPIITMSTSAGLVVFPLPELTEDAAVAAVDALNLELARVKRAE